MKKQAPSKSRYFLVEIIVNTLFFVLCASVTLTLFSKGFTETNESRALSISSLTAQNTAEIIKACEGDFTNFKEITGFLELDDGFVSYFNDNWETTDDETSKNRIIVKNEIKDAMLYSNITSFSGDEIIYSLDISSYLGGDFVER